MSSDKENQKIISSDERSQDKGAYSVGEIDINLQINKEI